MKALNIPSEKAGEIIAILKTLAGAINYDGDASSQVVFKLENGRTLRFGVTDDDCAATPGLWVDQYDGLNGELVRKHPQPNYEPKTLAALNQFAANYPHKFPHQRFGQAFVNHFGISGDIGDDLFYTQDIDKANTLIEKIVEEEFDNYV